MILAFIAIMVKIDEDYEGEMFSSVVLDGNNIITERSKPDYIFRFERLQNAIRAVEQLGWRTKTILKKGTYNNCLMESSTLTDNQKSALRKMNEFGIVHLVKYTGDKDKDDKIMIQHALDHNAWILTHDTFTKDHFKTLKEEKKYATINEINKRKVRITWGPDHQPIFTLPENEEALEATRVVEDTLNVELEELSGGCSIWLGVEGGPEVNGIVKMRQPVGRSALLSFAKEKVHKDACGAVSRRHFKIDYSGQDYYITDINSTNGTKLNDMKLPPHRPYLLTPSCVVSIGQVRIRID